MPSESINRDGKIVITLESDEAAAVCSPKGIELYLHKDANGVVIESQVNLAATDMALMYGDFEHEYPFTEDPDGHQSSN